jgi:hypothetical protein
MNISSKASFLSLIVVLLIFAVVGCVSQRRYFPYITFETNLSPGARVLVEPIVASNDFPKRFDRGLRALRQMIIVKLATAGYRVLSEDDVALALKGLHPEGQNLYDPATGKLDLNKVESERRKYLARLSVRGSCDIVVSCKVVTRPAEYWGSTARWDGVIRAVRIDETRMGAGELKVTGKGTGLSLGVLITDLQGSVLHMSFGGIDVMHRMGWITTETGQYYEVRENALDDQRMLAEAVALALHPFVTYVRYPENPKFSIEDPENPQVRWGPIGEIRRR